MKFCNTIKVNHFNFSSFHRLRLNYVMHELLRQISMLTFFFRLIPIALKVLREPEKYDVIHVHYRYPFLAFWIAKVMSHARTPIIFHCHNAWMTRQHIPLILRFFWFFDLIALRKADCIVALSDPVKQGLIRFYHAQSEKIVIIPNGVQLPKYERILKVDPNSGVTIICVANIMPLKNQEVLVDALSRLNKRVSNCRLVLVGEIVDQDYYMILCDKIERLDLVDNICFKGGISHSEVWKLLKSSDIAVLPSKFEAMSMSALEYLASGIPTLLSSIPSFINMCEEGTALFFDPDDASNIADEMLNVINNENLRKELSSKARMFATSHYSLDIVCKKIEELYLHLKDAK